MAKSWFKAVSPDRPEVSGILEEFSYDGYGKFMAVLSFCQENDYQEITEAVIIMALRGIGINKRGARKLLTKFQESFTKVCQMFDQSLTKAKSWFKAVSPDRPEVSGILEEFGYDGYGKFMAVLSFCQENDYQEITEAVIIMALRGIGINKRGARKLLAKFQESFTKVCQMFDQSLPKLSANFDQSLNKVSANFDQSFTKVCQMFDQSLPKLEAQNPHGSTRVLEEKRIEEKRIEEKEKKETPPKFSEGDLQTAKFIFEGVKRLDPKAKEPNFNTWAEEIRLMRERDNRTDDEIRAVFTWANTDDFWKKNILSPRKLREKFTQLTIAKQQRAPSRSIPGNAIVPAEQRTAGVLEF